jgi:hypothetical protein
MYPIVRSVLLSLHLPFKRGNHGSRMGWYPRLKAKLGPPGDREGCISTWVGAVLVTLLTSCLDGDGANTIWSMPEGGQDSNESLLTTPFGPVLLTDCDVTGGPWWT